MRKTLHTGSWGKIRGEGTHTFAHSLNRKVTYDEGASHLQLPGPKLPAYTHLSKLYQWDVHVCRRLDGQA